MLNLSLFASLIHSQPPFASPPSKTMSDSSFSSRKKAEIVLALNRSTATYFPANYLRFTHGSKGNRDAPACNKWSEISGKYYVLVTPSLTVSCRLSKPSTIAFVLTNVGTGEQKKLKEFHNVTGLVSFSPFIDDCDLGFRRRARIDIMIVDESNSMRHFIGKSLYSITSSSELANSEFVNFEELPLVQLSTTLKEFVNNLCDSIVVGQKEHDIQIGNVLPGTMVDKQVSRKIFRPNEEPATKVNYFGLPPPQPTCNLEVTYPPHYAKTYDKLTMVEGKGRLAAIGQSKFSLLLPEPTPINSPPSNPTLPEPTPINLPSNPTLPEYTPEELLNFLLSQN
jgi:hypothetical protein